MSEEMSLSVSLAVAANDARPSQPWLVLCRFDGGIADDSW